MYKNKHFMVLIVFSNTDHMTSPIFNIKELATISLFVKHVKEMRVSPSFVYTIILFHIRIVSDHSIPVK